MHTMGEVWQCPRCPVSLDGIEPRDLGTVILFHFTTCEGVSMPDRPEQTDILKLLDNELGRHQMLADDAARRGFPLLATQYNQMSLGIVECLKAIRRDAGSASWESQSPPQMPGVQNSIGLKDSPPS